MNLYSLDISFYLLIIICLILLWACFYGCGFRYKKFSKDFKLFNLVLLIVSLYGIAAFSIINRLPSDNHKYVFAIPYNDEFYREMFMNIVLYFPFGLSITALFGPYATVLALPISFGIEIWQYLTGSGLAQGTDVLCNTVGALFGSIPYILSKFLLKK